MIKPMLRRVFFLEDTIVKPCFSEEDLKNAVSQYGEENVRCDFEPNLYEGAMIIKRYHKVYADAEEDRG